jgi:hypothetical protein
MSNWRESILKKFVPNVSRLTVVYDPDNLLTEEELALELRKRGFTLVEFSDSHEFRYVYESQYRAQWDNGGDINLVVLLQASAEDTVPLPYDIRKHGRELVFNLGETFPNFSYPVIEHLDRSLLDKLFEAQNRVQLDRMGDNATKDFILRNVFGIAPELISTDVELLKMLLRIHYSNMSLPDMFASRLAQLLQQVNVFKDWPLSAIIPQANAFFAFIQERWPIFLVENGIQDHYLQGSYKKLSYSGPTSLPFAHQDILIYMDNLFFEGKLTPVKIQQMPKDAPAWITNGVYIDIAENQAARINGLLKRIQSICPNKDSRYAAWMEFSRHWAELSALVHNETDATYKEQFSKIGKEINLVFYDWLQEHYAGLVNLPPNTPTMLHHIPRYMAREAEKSNCQKVALIVVDGLAFDQWTTVKQILQTQNSNLIVRESAVFAWIPTLTSVSRQAMFSGKIPQYFPSSIDTTNLEEKFWKQFWENCGISKMDVAYKRGLGDGKANEALNAVIHGKTKVVGLVVDKVDKIMHGMQLGASGMHNQSRQWCQDGYLGDMIALLLEQKFQVWLTSDHGNIECSGIGKPSEGALAETRGERVRVYQNSELRSRISSQYTSAHKWPPIGLPNNYFPLIANGYDAFINTEEISIGHGGASIEEVIVPFVKFEYKEQ